jgi:hypothetical protein
MPTATLRPNGEVVSSVGNTTYVGGNLDTILRDDNHSTYANLWNDFPEYGGPSQIYPSLDDWTIPAGATIDGVSFTVRADTAFSGTKLYAELRRNNDSLVASLGVSGVTLSGTITDYVSGFISISLSQSEINGLYFWVEKKYNPSTNDSHNTYEVAVYIYYTTHTIPDVPTGLSRTGDGFDTTPNFSATVTDPDGNTTKARFELYQNDGTTLIGTVDSSFVASGGAATAEYTSALAVGTYKVRAKAIDSEGMESAWTSMLTFNVTQATTKDLAASWDVYIYATKDLAVSWDIAAGNVKDLVVSWNVAAYVTKDLVMSWEVQTPWTPITEADATWTRVGEL